MSTHGVANHPAQPEADRVFVGIPELTPEGRADHADERALKREEFAVGARIQALAHARDYHRFSSDVEVSTILGTAEKFAAYLLNGEVTR